MLIIAEKSPIRLIRDKCSLNIKTPAIALSPTMATLFIGYMAALGSVDESKAFSKK